jgi:hypothetical protein
VTSPPTQGEMTAAQHKDEFRGRCALALACNATITRTLANAIRVSPMTGCTDLGAIEACKEHMAKMGEWLDQAEQSARAVREAEAGES